MDYTTWVDIQFFLVFACLGSVLIGGYLSVREIAKIKSKLHDLVQIHEDLNDRHERLCGYVERHDEILKDMNKA